MRRQIKLSAKQQMAAVCIFSTLAMAGLIGGFYSLGASADDGDFVVQIPGTALTGGNNVMWSFGDNKSITLDFAVTDDYPEISSTNGGTITYTSFNDFISKFSATTPGDQCGNDSSFTFNFKYPGDTPEQDFNTLASCNYDNQTDKSAISIASNNFPGNISNIYFEVLERGSNPQSGSVVINVATDSIGSDNKNCNFQPRQR